MLAYFYCRNHANQLAISNIVTTAGIFTGGPLSLLNNLYCCSHFLAMGGHFARLISVTKAIVDAKCQIVRSAAHPACKILHDELVDYCVRAAAKDDRCSVCVLCGKCEI